MADNEVPEYIRDYITRSSKAMEDIAKVMQERNTQDRINEEKWRETITAMNSQFAIHQVDTESRFKEVCTAMSTQTESITKFQKEIVETAKQREDKYWDLIIKVVFVALIIIGGTLAARVLIPGFGG